MIAIVDYGLGNVHAIANIYARLGIGAYLARRPGELRGATHIILPGVGAFDPAIERLEAAGVLPELTASVLEHSVPLLGICVGMQMLAHYSEEGSRKGLGYVPGVVRKINTVPDLAPILPHMGWNTVYPSGDAGIFTGLAHGSRFYFLHSYYFEPQSSTDISAACMYGERFACAVQRRNIYGVQFHPEKSHHWGVKLLRNFWENC